MNEYDEGADLRASIDRALRDVHARGDHAAAAIISGRRLRIRRRATYGAVGIAAVAAIGAVSVPFAGGPGEARDIAPYAGVPTSAAPSGEACGDPDGGPGEPSAGPDDATFAPPGAPEGWWDMPAPAIEAGLERLIPKDTTLNGLDTGEGTFIGLLGGPDTTGRFSLTMRAPLPDNGDDTCGAELGHADRITCDTDPEWTGKVLRCDLLRDERGDEVGVVATHLDRGTTYHDAWLLGPQGGAINLYVANSTGEKPGYEQPTGTQPPLTFGDVRRLVQDPIWTSHRP